MNFTEACLFSSILISYDCTYTATIVTPTHREGRKDNKDGEISMCDRKNREELREHNISYKLLEARGIFVWKRTVF